MPSQGLRVDGLGGKLLALLALLALDFRRSRSEDVRSIAARLPSSFESPLAACSGGDGNTAHQPNASACRHVCEVHP